MRAMNLIEWLQEQQRHLGGGVSADASAASAAAASVARGASARSVSNGKNANATSSAAAAAPAAATLAGHPGDGLGFLTRLHSPQQPAGTAKHHDAQQHQHQHQQHQQQRKRKQQHSQQHSQQQQHSHHHRAAEQMRPAGVAVVSGLSMYYGVKGILKGYQTLRHRNLRHLICTVAPALDALGAKYWLDFGSLLGAHRERDVIPYDNDADVCLLNPDWDALLPALRAALPQFRVFFVVPSEDRSIRWLRVVHQVGVMDLYGAYYEECGDDGEGGAGGGGGCVKGLECGGGGSGSGGSGAGSSAARSAGSISIPQGHGDLCDVPARLVLPLGRLKFRGVSVSSPGDVRGVLEHRYGPDYMVPRYLDKGRDTVEQGKLYARLLTLLGRAGLRV